MAINDILAQSGDNQDFIVEIPTGNVTYFPLDGVSGENDAILCAEIPVITPGGGGGNIFIMSE
jgi:hypothetical protein